MTYLVTGGCIDILDKSCMDVCPVDCLYLGARMTYIHPAECIDCGACEPACPQQAIYFAEELPEELSTWQAVNTEFFTDIGSPGGSTEIDLTDRDHPSVSNI